MKKLKRLLVALAGLSLSVGAAVGVGLKADKDLKEAAAEAEVMPNNSTIYVDLTDVASWFGNEGGVVKLHLFGGSSPAQSISSTSSSGNMYVFTTPAEGNFKQFDIFRTVDGSSWTHQTTDQDYSSEFNVYKVYQTDAQKGQTGANSLSVQYAYRQVTAVNDKYFVNVASENSYWYTENAHTFLYTFSGSTHYCHEMTRLGQTDLFVYKYLASETFDFAIIVRGKSTFDGSTWDGQAYNQSGNFGFTKTTKRGVYLFNDGSIKTSLEAADNSFLLIGFGNYFLSATTNYCTNVTLDDSAQTAIKNTFDAVCAEGTDTKATFAALPIIHSADPAAHTNKANEAISRYWDMTHNTNNHSGAAYGDFLDLGSEFLARTRVVTVAETELANTTNTMVIVIVAVSASILLLVGGYFYFRKRREDR